MTNFTLILQMSDHFGFAGQRPDKTSTVRRRIFLGWSDADLRLMDVRRRLIHDVDQQLDETVSHHFVVVVVTQLESVVEEDVCFVFVVIRIHDLQITSIFIQFDPIFSRSSNQYHNSPKISARRWKQIFFLPNLNRF